MAQITQLKAYGAPGSGASSFSGKAESDEEFFQTWLLLMRVGFSILLGVLIR